MKVIGAGLPRTATTSQKIALEMLGLGPCYHMVNVLSDLTLVPGWRRALVPALALGVLLLAALPLYYPPSGGAVS